MICNMQTLADDMRAWSKKILNPHVLTLASPLPRVASLPEIHFGEKIIVGYIGTIDKLRGVDILLEAIRMLPENFTLRIVGRFRKENGVDPNWLNLYLDDPNLQSKLDINIVKQIDDVAAEIDLCDILIQPASTDLFDERYTAPLKSYGYMVRGKPIIAGNVTSHHELFNNGEAAVLYNLNPEHLSECIKNLANHPELAEKIAYNAWKKAEYFSFSRKVDDLLSMIEEVRVNKPITYA